MMKQSDEAKLWRGKSEAQKKNKTPALLIEGKPSLSSRHLRRSRGDRAY